MHGRGLRHPDDRWGGFLAAKRRPLCLCPNSDPNPIASGPLARDTIAGTNLFLMWAGGSSTNPVGRFCEICAETRAVGGFADECADLGDFCANRIADNNFNKE
eukprot:4375990-Pyramimonas_sp.AAC.1